jgi:hypothetical protein
MVMMMMMISFTLTPRLNSWNLDWGTSVMIDPYEEIQLFMDCGEVGFLATPYDSIFEACTTTVRTQPFNSGRDISSPKLRSHIG